ncbi:MAG TPA: TetR/AcrR family transcriptional regulator [Jiangellaceae bacterium]
MNATRGIRERVRDELVREIKDVARRHLSEQGAAGLSVRAITREMGMASSAVYRYYPSRDALLTALIIDAYDGVGAAAAAADAAVPRTDHLGRWIAIFRAVRAWALANPHEYALVYGSPVPGYVAPADTVAPAARVAYLLVAVVVDASASGTLEPLDDDVPLTDDLRRDAEARLTEIIAELLGERTDVVAAMGPSVALGVVDAWTALFGAVSFELFGHYHRVIDARADHLDRLAVGTARAVGLSAR